MVKNGFRVRPAGLTDRRTGLTAFRIEDARGRQVARIAATHGAQALALYWRGRGCRELAGILPGYGPDDRLRRSIDMARSRLSSDDMNELPLPEGAAGRQSPRPRVPRAARRPAAGIAQDDLFQARAPVAMPAEPAPLAPAPASMTPAPAAPVAPTAPPRRRVAHLDAGDIQLARVHYRGLQPSDPPDSFLYHIASSRNAEQMLRDGLDLDPRQPLQLTERSGVPYWLSLLMDDADPPMDEPEEEEDIAVLRLKRFMVDDLIEDDPDATRSSGVACYFLTGGG
ncbi:hypothetical protein AA13595_0858 [Gluconacetobacter johannae DSM 13595]|nr:hypothetical protein [Gluconacetobacter johannae]GBQ82218.1 hypothetical protein AA13595_0858 [Gluconacetobacter johannae DSM 13595]